jgi:hypothetical protein
MWAFIRTQSIVCSHPKMQVYFSEDWLPPGEYRKEGGFYSTGQLKTMDQTRIFRMFSITKRDQNGTDFIKYFAASVAMGVRPVGPQQVKSYRNAQLLSTVFYTVKRRMRENRSG